MSKIDSSTSRTTDAVSLPERQRIRVDCRDEVFNQLTRKSDCSTSSGDCGRHSVRQPEWPTIAIAVLCYGGWIAVVLGYPIAGPWLSVLLLTLILVLHSSLQHEIIHGHPFQDRRLNRLLGFPPLGVFIPFDRFHDLHLKHHRDHSLTDPFDDPESNYLSLSEWLKLSVCARLVLKFNNTLLGRVMVGPALGVVRMYNTDMRAVLCGERIIVRAYLRHILGLVVLGVVLWWASEMSFWHYVMSCYLALSLLKIRTFLEHRAHDAVAHRTAIVEDRGLLAWLFLNNNLHAVHHARPGLPWYQLPLHYRENRAEFVRRNNGYVFASYWVIICRYLLRAKDPVSHPFLGTAANRVLPREVAGEDGKLDGSVRWRWK